MHPVNLALRAVLELVMLVALGVWAYRVVPGPLGWAAALGVPLAAAILWGVFAVPGDPSRGKDGHVHVPGAVRLALELGLFASGALALWHLGHPSWAWGLGTAVLLHYALSHKRIRWLIRQ